MDQEVIKLTQADIDALGYDLEAEVVAFRQAVEDHKETEGVPAPTSFPLVERIARGGAVIEIVPPPPVPEPPPKTTVTMDMFWSRMTEDEAVAMETQVNGVTVRLRRVFNALVTLPNSHPDYTAIRSMAIAAVGGEARADEILAPEF